MTLTGRTRHVHYKPFLAASRLVLQVEESGYVDDNMCGFIECRLVVRWRNATVEDLSEFFVKDMGLNYEN